MVVKCFRGAECDIDHCLIVAEVRGALSVHKKISREIICEQFSMKKLTERNVGEDLQL
jgi:hypothetical protein